jgi:hypothetical protein
VPHCCFISCFIQNEHKEDERIARKLFVALIVQDLVAEVRTLFSEGAYGYIHMLYMRCCNLFVAIMLELVGKHTHWNKGEDSFEAL